jgi:Large extracellular alpha-helical protein
MKTKNIAIWILIVLSLGHSRIALAQQGLDSLKRSFNAYRQSGMQEKLYLHTDREFYLTGEVMYFRVYQVDATLHSPTNISKVAYIEILDGSNQAVAQVKVKLSEKGGDGSVFVPATLASGNYLVRAYTQWMKNFPADYFFHKHITVVNPFVRPEPVVTKRKPGVKVDFFPEGGHLVAGVRSKVAFKVSNVDEGEDYMGYILGEDNDTLQTFSPLKFNLGHFYFTPESGRSYRCIMVGKTGAETTHTLPEVSSAGYVMSVSDSSADQLKVSVSAKGIQSGSLVYLFVHSRQMVVYAEARPTGNSSAEFFVDRRKLPEGISHITVFNDKLQPVCERLYFTRPMQTLQLVTAADQKSYTTRRKVSIDVRSMLGGQPVSADISLAVFKLDSLGSNDQSDILSYLLLSSDLRGEIENPSYYLSDDPKVAEVLDNLMLTHGWRRFKWEEVLKGDRKYAFVPEVRTHIVSGKVTRADGTPVQHVLSYLSSPAKLVGLNGSRSDQDGNVTFEVQDFWGSRKLILQPIVGTDSTHKFSINDPFSKSYSAWSVSPFSISSSVKKNLQERSFAMQVHDIHYREADRLAVKARVDSSAFYGVGDQVYYLDNYTRFPVLEEVMREYVPGVLVRKRRDGFHFIVLDATKRGVLDGDPLILLDGVPVLNLNTFMKFDPLKIRKLEVVMRNYIIGPVRAPGIVSFTTYTGDLAGYEIKPPAVVMDYQGLQVNREFYSPSYDNAKARNNRMPDQRTLLHWKPYVTTTAEGRQTIEFYTSDIPGHYQVVLEGITSSGKAGSASTTFEVRREEVQ